MTLTPRELDHLYGHYTGNCMGCRRCALYEAIDRNEPGAVEEYVRYMLEHHNKKIKVRPD